MTNSITNPQVIEEYANEETLAMVVVDNGQYGVLVESLDGSRMTLEADGYLSAQDMAKSLTDN